MKWTFCGLIAALLVVATTCRMRAAERAWPGVYTIMEDEAADLLKLLNNPWGDPGQGQVEEKDTFSGPRCIKIIPLQRYTNKAGWELKIREKPGPGEYRYLRYAWKSVGGTGIMLQLHDTDWNMRYVAGQNHQGWAAKSIAEKAPERWTVVTRDLFADWGERTLTGIALTAFDGDAGLFDHIYLGRTLDDLERIDATGLTHGAAKLTDAELADLWNKLAAADDRDAYRARWTFINAPDQAVPYLRRKLTPAPSKIDVKQIESWIAELDDASFARRERAQRLLQQNLDDAVALLRQSLDNNPPPETRRRIEKLLGAGGGLRPEEVRQERAIKVLALIDSAASRQLLDEFAKGPATARTTLLAREAIKNKN